MNKVWKNIATGGLIVAVSAASSAVTVKSLADNQYNSSEDRYTSAPALSAGEHGFVNTSAAIAPQNLGSAPDLTPAAESSVKAVVHIKTEGERTVASQGIDPFEFFFGGRGRTAPQTQPVVGYGSGVIISNDGYIMTNNHVIDNSNKISVTLEDNRTFTAKLIGTDPRTDIALIKIEGKDLPTIPFGDSDKLRLGEWVLAVGNPFNLTGTVTAGIVSAKARSTSRGTGPNLSVESFIQTDAAVNSGNSGGALVNARGELVGINTMIYSQTGNYAGYSFAVPINIAAKVVEDIKKYGTVQRGVLGIIGGDVQAELVKKEGLRVNQGVYVSDFAEISAALAAGIEKGDVITTINGANIENMGQLQSEIARHRPGDVISVVVDRKGSKKTFKVTLKNSEGGQGIVKNKDTSSSKLGATLKALDSESLRAYGLSYGVQVQSVGSGPLAKAGVQNGFIILMANNVPIRSTENLDKVISLAKGSKGRSSIYLRGFYPQTGEVMNYDIDL
ncbi:MAG: Do family serine endopeptidase [Porphyromonas sp.]|nr:Do family serine endopeptidase [Porphyromonas sp.]